MIIQDLSNTDKKYSIIYADPPWTFSVWSKKGEDRSAKKHYDVMTLNDIKSMPVQNICEKDCVLLMWATYPNLIEAIETGAAWGFKYKTCAFTWAKRNKKNDDFFFGLGYYTRANPEVCLLFTRGKPLKRLSRSVRQLCTARIGRHSEKPAEIRDRIVELFGDLPRIELFARQEVPGWDAMGNELGDSNG